MTREEQIALAKKIAQALPEVTRNEWMRWMQVVKQRGLGYAIRYAEQLSKDPTVRPAVRRANRLIAQAVRSQEEVLRSLGKEDLNAVLGHVSWLLAIHTRYGFLSYSTE